MINYLDWPRKKVMVTSLKLDDQNPRIHGFDKTPTQPQIIDYMVEQEDAYTLAKNIIAQGYYINEEPIVYKEGNKYVVLEGNRRVTACKILINPALLRSNSKRKSLIKQLEYFDNSIIAKLEVRIAPSREAADEIIVNRHTEGSVLKKWDKTKQDRFFYLRFTGGESIESLAEKFNISKGDMKKALKRYAVYQELLSLNLPETTREGIEDEKEFNMTNVERFYNSKLGKEFLAFEVDNEMKIKRQLPKEEYVKRLSHIATMVVNDELNSRTYGDEKQQKEFMQRLSARPEFNLGITPDKKYEGEYDEPSPNEPSDEIKDPKNPLPGPRGPKSQPKNKLIPLDYKWKTGISRIDAIFSEIQKANLDTQFNSTAVLFRSYLDMLVYQYLYKNEGIKGIITQEQQKLDTESELRLNKMIEFIKGLGVKEEKIDIKLLKKVLKNKTAIGKDFIPSLKYMLSYLAADADLLPDSKLRQVLGSYVKGGDGFLDHNDFNLLVHNEYFIKSKEDLKKAWTQLAPILDYITQRISQK